MEEQFKIGDNVYLKSGSPKMTIRDIDNDKITVNWFDIAYHPTSMNNIDGMIFTNPNEALYHKDQLIKA